MNQDARTAWDFLTLALWALFFGVGLAPDPVFRVLREIAGVTTSTALINSSLVLTAALAVYIAFFTLRRCREAGLNDAEARGRALQIGLLGLVAFLEIPVRDGAAQVRTLLELVLQVGNIPMDQTYLRTVVLFIGASKLLAWWYLFSLVIRYHAFGMRRVFATMPSVFPSAHSGVSKVSEPPPVKRPSAGDGDRDLSVSGAPTREEPGRE